MARKREKTELERYVRGAMVQLRLQAAKRPEEWLRWSSPVGFAVVFGPGHYAVAAGFFVASLAAQVGLAHRRLGGGTLNEKVAKSLPEAALRNADRRLRKGSYEDKVGAEARAVLESCAASANAAVAAAAEAHFANAGRPVVLEAFRPISKSLDVLMKEALVRADRATIMGRLPDDEALADLRAIDASLAELRDEAQRLAREFRAIVPLPEDASLAAERLEARRELDQNA